MSLLLSPRVGWTQTEPLNETWRWVQYTTAEGLPTDQVLDVVETTTGQLWTVTERGLARYDGYRWRPVTVKTPLPERRIRATPDLEGKLLVVEDEQLYQGDEHGFARIALAYEGQELWVVSAVPLDTKTLFVADPFRLYRYREGQVDTLALPDVVSPGRYPLAFAETRSLDLVVGDTTEVALLNLAYDAVYLDAFNPDVSCGRLRCWPASSP